MTNMELRKMLLDYPDHWEVRITNGAQDWQIGGVDSPEEEDLLDPAKPYILIESSDRPV